MAPQSVEELTVKEFATLSFERVLSIGTIMLVATYVLGFALAPFLPIQSDGSVPCWNPTLAVAQFHFGRPISRSIDI
jgi:hypothetical protein